MLLDLDARQLMMREQIDRLHTSSRPGSAALRRFVGRGMITLGGWIAGTQPPRRLGRRFA